MSMHVTDHAKMRGEQRLDERLSKRDAETAFSKGKEFSRYDGELKDYLRSKSRDGHYVAKAYEDAVWVFENSYGHRLLTVYKLPAELTPSSKFEISKKALEPRCIALTSKKDGSTRYWTDRGELSEDIADALEFRSQIQAENYFANNRELGRLSADYDVAIF